jgi:hypothetical protein
MLRIPYVSKAEPRPERSLTSLPPRYAGIAPGSSLGHHRGNLSLAWQRKRRLLHGEFEAGPQRSRH